VRILSRYILREHAGPLVFSLTALTSLLLLQYVARQLDKLVGKGLPWRVIGEFLVLSLPFTVAMTLPMAVLVATLHAFGRLAAEHEVTAFKASGVRVRTLMAPVLGASLLLSAVMLFFNDQVLPRANHRLSILLTDIVSVRPTVGLRAQVLTKVTETFYIRAGWLDAVSNRMRDVEIHDVSNSAQRKTVWADSGTFALSPDSIDLQLVLFDGEQLEFPQGDARKLQRTDFRQQVIKVPNMARGFSATGAQGQYKGEREQGICELQREYEARATEYESRRQRWIAQLRAEAAGGSDSVLVVPRPRPAHRGLARLYCTTIPGLFRPEVAEAAPAQEGVRVLQDSAEIARAVAEAVRQDSLRRDSVLRVEDSLRIARGEPPVRDPNLPPPAIFAVTPEALTESLIQMSAYAVEVQKKFALSLACFVFVLFGPPIALRFPRGGVGVTIGVSLVVFGAYYVCLMAGEVLGDKGRLGPVPAMWTANVLFTLAGLVLLWRVERTTDSSRGGGLRDWWADRRARRRVRASRAAAPVPPPAGA
jgi:lipopolysaccharide export system permease protein